jgi:hypothetical protein
MKLGLSILGFAAAGEGAERLPVERRVPMPEPKGARGGGRLPRLALELARGALGPRAPSESLGVFFGTALGCLTETEAFVAHMLCENEATPKPRAFSSSVHNACASFVALNLEARGECTTFVHGELSFAHALFAAARAHARRPGAFLVGAADEAPSGTFARLAGAGAHHEGGAMLLLGDEDSRARLESLTLARAKDPLAWAEDLLAPSAPDLLILCGVEERESAIALPRLTLPPHHSSMLATATVLAAAQTIGELGAPALERVAVLARSPSDEVALLVVARSEA